MAGREDQQEGVSERFPCRKRGRHTDRRGRIVPIRLENDGLGRNANLA